MTHVKVCGSMRAEDAIAAKEAGADFVGLVFAPGSRRRLTIDAASEIVEAVGTPLRDVELPQAVENVIDWFRGGAEALDRLLQRKRPLTVGVFEDQPIDEVNTTAVACGLDLVQLSGDESWAYCRLVNRPVIKAIEPRGGADAVIGGLESGAAVACMLDVSRGRGIAVDRAIAADVAARMPVWLAGGLTPENVAEAVRDVRPWAVDVSSGVETNRAKDPAKIEAFVLAAKGALVS